MVCLEEEAEEAACIRAEPEAEAEAGAQRITARQGEDIRATRQALEEGMQEDRPTDQASYSEVPPSPKMYKRSKIVHTLPTLPNPLTKQIGGFNECACVVCCVSVEGVRACVG